jgi:WD40 repeat protein
LLIVDEFLFSASSDGSIKKWKVATGEIAFSISSSTFKKFSPFEFEGVLFAGVGGNSFSKFKVENGSLIETIKGFS